MRSKKQNEVRTPQTKAKIGDRILIEGEPHLLVRQGDKKEVLSANEIIEALYGQPVNCVIHTEGKE